MIGQGLANLGQEVGKGVETYFKKQDMMKAQIGEIAAFAASDPEYLATLPPKFLEKARAGDFNPREVSEFYANGAMTRKIKNEKIQNNLIISQTNAYNAKLNDEAQQRTDEANKRTAGVLVGNAYRNKDTSLDLTGVDPAVAAIAAPIFLQYANDLAQQKAFVANQDRIAGAPEKILNSYLKPFFVELDGKRLHRTYDANGVERYDEVTPSYQQKIDLQQSRLSTLLDTIADAEFRNDMEVSNKAQLQVLAEFSGIAQTPSELYRRLKPLIAGRAKNINEKLPRGVTDENYRNPNFNAESISRISPPVAELPAYRDGVMVQPTQMPVSPQSTQMSVVNGNPENYPSSFAAPTGGMVQASQTQQATSAPSPVSPNVQQAGAGSSFAPPPQPTPVSTPYDSGYDQGYGDDRGGGQSSLGASSVTPSPAFAKPSVPSTQAANLTPGAAKTVTSILDRADQVYIGAEVVNAVFNDPKLRTEVKDLAKKASGKLQFLSKYLGSKTGEVLKVSKAVLGKVARPVMIVNSADKIIGKYVAKDFPDVDHQRVSSAVMENVAVWFGSQNKSTKDETLALLAQKSKYLMGSNMSREAKLAKNAEYIKMMGTLLEQEQTLINPAASSQPVNRAGSNRPTTMFGNPTYRDVGTYSRGPNNALSSLNEKIMYGVIDNFMDASAAIKGISKMTGMSIPLLKASGVVDKLFRVNYSPNNPTRREDILATFSQ